MFNNINVADWSFIVAAFIAFEWILRVFMLVTVPRNRKPTSATAWLMLIMIEPIIGSLFYVSFGSPKLPKYRRQLQKSADKKIAKELQTYKHATALRVLTPNQRKVVKLNNVLGGMPVWGGSSANFYDEYDTSIMVLVNDLKKAKKRIYFEYFILVQDETSEPVLQELENAVKRGVEVYVLFDALASRVYPNFKSLKKRLTASGIKWRAMLPFNIKPGKGFTRPDLRNHRKIVTIDGAIAYTGSQNMVTKNYHRKDELYYEELVMRVKGPVVWQLSALFRTDWYSETKEFLPADEIPARVGPIEAQVLPSGPGHNESTNLKLYTQLVQNADKKIVIVTPYFVPDEALMTALTSAAQRGVEVTLINSEIIDKTLVGYAQRSYYEELLKAGVHIYLYNSPVFLHTKHLTVDDDTIVIGSSNLDIRSFELDLEVSVVMFDIQSVKKLRNIESRYMAASKRITYTAWQKRSSRKKALENVSRLTAALQ